MLFKYFSWGNLIGTIIGFFIVLEWHGLNDAIFSFIVTIPITILLNRWIIWGKKDA